MCRQYVNPRGTGEAFGGGGLEKRGGSRTEL